MPSCQSGNGVTCIFFKIHQRYFVDNQLHSLSDVQNQHYMEKVKLASAVTNMRKITGAETQGLPGSQYWHRNRKR